MNKTTKINRKVLLVLASISSIIYIGWRMFFTIPTEYGLISFIAGISLALSEAVGVIEAFSHYRNLSSLNVPEIPKIKKDWYPDIDVFISTHSESTDLLYKTVNGCIHMKYPDKSKVHIYICDDSDRAEMKELANRLGVGYFGISDNKYAKAGNINNALSKTNSPLVATFDADMIPRKDFLIETVPYFYLPKMKQDEDKNWIEREDEEIDENYKIGFIQTPQSFYNPDLFQFNLYSEKNIPNEQDYFFKEVNVGRNKSNSPIYAGSNTLISREALEEVGGITTGNITEDFATGIKIQGKGYTCFAISKVLANGLAPIDFQSLLKQRQRWGRGCVQTIKSFKFIFGELSIRAKLSYLTCFLYWWTFFRRFVYIISPILYTVFGLVIVECTLNELLFIWLPSYILYNTSLRYLSGNIRNQKWSNIVDTIIFPYMILPILLETIGIKLKKFSVTPKDRVNSKNVEFKYAIPHIFLIIASVIGLVFCVTDMIRYKSLGNIILLYWSILNLYFLIMAVFFMLSRVNYRSEERYYTRVKVEIDTGDKVLEGVTSDISIGGMGIILDTPEYIPYDEDVDISVYYDEYKAFIKGKIVHASKLDKKWKYSIEISSMTEANKMEYYQIVYDRNPTLPTKMKSNTIKEILNNTVKRTMLHNNSNRRLPRIDLGVYINRTDKGKVYALNFNYEYILLKHTGNEDETIDLDLGSDLILNCTLKNKNKDTLLYKINNFKSVACDERLSQIIFDLSNIKPNDLESQQV